MMSNTEVYESLMTVVCALDRRALIERLTHFPGELPLDFTEDFLSQCETEKLRHVLLAAEWRARCRAVKVP